MMKKFLKRFQRIENNPVDALMSQNAGLKISKRFERLEINDKKIEFSITDKVSIQEISPEGQKYNVFCIYCGQESPHGATVCSYCNKPIENNTAVVKAKANIKYYVFCTFCGSENLEDAKICSNCKHTIQTDYIADYQGKANIVKKCVCGAVNLKERKNCWVCGRDFSLWGDTEVNYESQNIITLNINGRIYKSSDPNLPSGIVALMEKIRRDGYSDKLVNDWMQEVNQEIDLSQNNLEGRLSSIRMGLTWRAVLLILFLLFMIFQLATCFNYAGRHF